MRSPRTGPVLAGLAVAVVAAVGVWLTWRVFVDTRAGQQVDNAALAGAVYGQTKLWRVAQPVLDVISVGFLALVMVAAILIAVLRRRWALALQVAVLMGGANLTTQILKYGVLDHPDLGVVGRSFNTLPSGHTTAAASAAAALVLVVPPRVRPWAALLGAGYTAATGVSTLIGQWHRPSDVVAGMLVVLAWSALACVLVTLSTRPRAGVGTATAGVRRVGPDAATREVSSARPLVIGTAVLLVLAGVFAAVPGLLALRETWAGRGSLEGRSDLLTAYAGGAFGSTAVVCLAFAVLLVLRHWATAGVQPVSARLDERP